MKKVTLFIYPFMIGVFSGGFMQCFLSLLAVMMSPYSDRAEKGVLLFCGLFAFLFAILIVAAFLLNVRDLLNLNRSKVKMMIAAQVCTVILVFFASWAVSEIIFDGMYNQLLIG